MILAARGAMTGCLAALANDTLRGDTPHDWLFGGGGNDSLTAQAQYVVPLGGVGNLTRA